ncbi:hypothetical protein BDV93DRAFT_506003 [Ceratobasidium sp. AG-I]|nr:hypothetical protein BDV93DRAFT_506003 [Ceratobasidium sp. AG-I]
MKLLAFLCLVVGVLGQDQTLSLGITATATPSATLPITPPPQRSLAACSADPLWRRLRNSAGVDPCALAMNLQQMCTTIDPIPALTGGESYTGPTSVEAATPCICTTVMYNLVAGCAACQHQLSTNVTRNWVPWSTWSALCQNRAQIVDGVWGRSTQYNSTIPAWALAKVFQSDYFNLQQAVNVGLTSASSAPTSTSTSPAAAPSNSSQIGAIVGGILGGVGFLLLLLTVLFCFLRRRQRRWEEQEGVNRPRESFVGKPPIKRMSGNDGGTLQKPYGVAGLTSPRPDFDEKPRPVRTETALPDVLADEHRQGKPEYTMPAGGFTGGFNRRQNDYTPVPNPGVAGVGAGGRGLAPVNRVPPPVGPAGAAAQMLADDMAAAQRNRQGREGIFREDFSASEGHGYRSSTDAEGQNGNGNGNGYRSAYPPSSYPHHVPPVPSRFNNNGNGNGGNGYGNGGNDNVGTRGTYSGDQPDEDVHAYSTVGDASISLYPSSADHHDPMPPPFVGGFSPVPEKDREEYRLPERGYSSGYVIPESAGSGNSGGNGSGGQNSPGLDTDPFAVNRRPAAFSRVFGDRPSASGTGNGRPSTSPTAPTGGQGRSPVVGRAGGSPTLTRGGGPSPVLARGPTLRGVGGTGGPQNMGFGRQQSANAPWNNQPRDSNGFSEGSSPTAVGYPGDVGSNRDDGSPIPTAPFVGRSGYGANR